MLTEVESVEIELGPHAALSGPLEQTFMALAGEKRLAYVQTLVRDGKSTANLMTTVGQFHSLGVPLKFEPVCPGKAVLTSLPTCPWHHEKRQNSGTRAALHGNGECINSQSMSSWEVASWKTTT